MNGRLILITICLALVSACGGNKSCFDPKHYQEAQQYDPVAVPDDLDDLQSHKELRIPEPSPRPPRPEDGSCLESPPAFQSTSE